MITRSSIGKWIEVKHWDDTTGRAYCLVPLNRLLNDVDIMKVRDPESYDADELDDLGKSLQKNQANPVHVWADPIDKGTVLRVIGGNRRVSAMRQRVADGGFAKDHPTPVFLHFSQVKKDLIATAAADNSFRKDLEDAELLRAFKQASEAGYTVNEIAGMYGVSGTTVSRYLVIGSHTTLEEFLGILPYSRLAKLGKLYSDNDGIGEYITTVLNDWKAKATEEMDEWKEKQREDSKALSGPRCKLAGWLPSDLFQSWVADLALGIEPTNDIPPLMPQITVEDKFVKVAGFQVKITGESSLLDLYRAGIHFRNAGAEIHELVVRLRKEQGAGGSSLEAEELKELTRVFGKEAAEAAEAAEIAKAARKEAVKKAAKAAEAARAAKAAALAKAAGAGEVGEEEMGEEDQETADAVASMEQDGEEDDGEE